MSRSRRPRRQPTDDWQQVRLLVDSPEQKAYELVRPIVLFGQPTSERARETGISAATLRRKASRFAAVGMRSLFAEPIPSAGDRRALPPEIRHAIVTLKAEYPPFSLREIAAICRASFHRPVDHQTVGRVLAAEPLPLDPPRRCPRYHELPGPVQRRKAIVDLYHDGWSPRAIAGYLATSRARVHEVLKRWDEDGWDGLPDRSRAPHAPARKVDLTAMAAIRTANAAEASAAKAASEAKWRGKEDDTRRAAEERALGPARIAYLAAGGTEAGWAVDRDAVAADIRREQAVTAGAAIASPGIRSPIPAGSY